jgi:hypothetical protein
VTPIHIDEELLIGYCELSVTAATAAAIEAHLMICAICRLELGAAAAVTGEGRDGPEQMWDGILERVDRPRRSITERLLGAVGVRAETAKLLATTPALRLAWLAAVGLVAAFAVAAASHEGGDPWPLLVLAPLLPLAGVATAYGPALDPTYEIGVAAPMSAMRLTLLRTLAVLATTMPVLLIATLAAPGAGWSPLGWLLPALALVSVTLALSTWVSPEGAGIIVGAAWLIAIVVLIHRDAAGDFFARSMIFAPSGQAVTALLAVAGAAIVVARRQCFDMATVNGGTR